MCAHATQTYAPRVKQLCFYIYAVITRSSSRRNTYNILSRKNSCIFYEEEKATNIFYFFFKEKNFFHIYIYIFPVFSVSCSFILLCVREYG